MKESRRHFSSAGVEWVVGSTIPLNSRELEQMKEEVSFDGRKEISLKELTHVQVTLQKVKRYLGSQGISESYLNKLDGVRVVEIHDVLDLWGIGAAWIPEHGVIHAPDQKKARPLLAHEAVHALGKNRITASNKNPANQVREVVAVPVIRRSGLETRTIRETPLFHFLNEVITDEVAIRALNEGRKGPHREKRAFFNEIMRAVAKNEKKIKGVLTTQDTVWRAFLLSYFEGWDPSLKKAIVGTFGPEALKILAKLHPNHLLFDANRKYAQDNLPGVFNLHTLTRELKEYFSLNRKKPKGENLLERLSYLETRMNLP
ncbi:hypothetical protein K2X83_00390 [Patescibacteria group bacterium]|nr:hypothetical protein [Patescibacteria group bacterium]